MTFRGTLRRCFVWLLCISLCLGLAVPALAEDATGSEIRLLRTEGTVKVTSTSGKSYSTREDMRLYNGYVISTEEASYAWITLDSEKAVKLDQCSSLEVRRSGKTLELMLKSGELFFNVTAPLKEDEKLNIRTSTMVTGVRGTAGWVRQIDLDHSEVGILEGRVVCRVVNPVTGASRTLTVKAGEIGDLWIYEADSAGEGAEARIRRIGSMNDISGFILEEILKDENLRKRIEEETGLDFSGLTEELVAEKLAAEQEEIRKRLEEIESKKLDEVISKDPLWEGEQQGEGTGTSYTITWSMMGVEETTVWEAGKTPWHADPYIPEGWAFAGWTPDIQAASRDTTYTAIFWRLEQYQPDPQQPEQPEQYTVTWIIDGVRTQTVYAENSLPTHENPVKDGYTFIGWEPPISPVSGDAEYTAVFRQAVPEEYTITWRDDEGNILSTSAAAPGELPNYPGEQPAKEGFRFVGWEPQVTEAWEDAEYTAVFEALDPDAETAEITWVINGTTETETWEIGTVPSHDIPSRDPSADTTFTFAGWYDGSTVYGPDDALPAVTGAVTYEAEFREELRSYAVTWVVDGVSEEETYTYGDTPTHPIPEKAPTDTTVYRFLGWDDGTNTYAPEDLPTVTGDVTYTAKIEETERTYTITWIDGNGDTREDQVAYGVTPTYTGPTPVKTGNAQYSYSFLGWDPSITAVTGDAEYTAQFEEILNQYTVTWVVEGQTPTEETYDYGAMPVYPEGEPFREETASAFYEFDGWSPEIVTVTGNITYTAQFIARYAITPPEPTDGEYGLDKDWAENGETVTLTMTPNDGYGIFLNNISVTGDTSGSTVQVSQGATENTFTFVMPDEPVTIEAEFVALYELNVSEGLLIQADVTVNGEPMTMDSMYVELPAGAAVTLTITPHDGYRIFSDPVEGDGVYVVADTEVPVTKSGANTYAFTMPEEMASLEVNMQEAQAIEIEYADYGGDENTGIVTATVNGATVSQAFAGDTVILDITLYNGYSVLSIGYYVMDDYYTIDPVDGVYSFEMADTSVRVLVTFTS